MKLKFLKIISLCFLVAALFFLAFQSLLAAERPPKVSSGELVENQKKYEGREVVFTGEVVGEIMKRGRFAWIHINDDPYAFKSIPAGGKLAGYNSGQSIWIPYKEVKKLSYTGSYSAQGDLVEIRGVFYGACVEHRGEMDIHATSLKVLRRGYSIKKSVPKSKIVALGAFVFLAISLYSIKIFKNRISLYSTF